MSSFRSPERGGETDCGVDAGVGVDEGGTK